MSESKIQSDILAYLRTLPNCKPIKIIAANERGIPDILCCYKGRFVAFEVKQPGKQLEPIQLAQAAEIIKAGGECFLVRSVKEVQGFVEKIV